jgi:shikimate kinase
MSGSAQPPAELCRNIACKVLLGEATCSTGALSWTMDYSGNVFLVGPMGVGKTTIGRALAERMKLDFFDSDQEIEAATGADIPWIFDVEGEQGFRQREVKMINLLSGRKNIVLATGGGAVLDKKNRKRLKKRGLVVYLRASIKQQIDRTARDRHRPLLQNGNPEQTIKDLMVVREPLYLEVADVVVDTNRRNPKSVSNEIIKQIKIHQQSSGS